MKLVVYGEDGRPLSEADHPVEYEVARIHARAMMRERERAAVAGFVMILCVIATTLIVVSS